MNKAYIIHGWGSTPESDWFPWLKKELESRQFKVECPEMPDTENPKIEAWLEKLNQIINLNENTFLIGHSIGCQAILRYIEKLDKINEDKKIKAIILVAPWLHINYNSLDQEEKSIAEPWSESPTNLEKVKSHVEDTTIIYSSTDPFCLIEDIILLEEKLEAIAVDMGDMGHLNAEAGVYKLPIILDNIDEIILENPEEIK